jgi:glutamate-1-semialdehyde aminotransferase
MGKANCLEIEFDERCYRDLVDEAQRLGVGVEEIVQRAAAAWLVDMAEQMAAVHG